MCDTGAYVRTGEKSELVLESLDVIRPEAGRVYLRSMFGEEMVFEGRIVEISLSKHKVVLERA